MDPTKRPQLAAEIASGPLAAELAPLTQAGADAAAADVLNRRDRAGYVPRRAVVVALAANAGAAGLMKYALHFGKLPEAVGGGDMGSSGLFPAYCLFEAIGLIAGNPESDSVKLMVADLNTAKAAVQPLIDAGAIPAKFFTDLAVAEVKISRAEEASLVPFGVDVPAADVEAVRKGNT